MIDYSLLKQLCHIQANSGNEGEIKQFLIDFIKKDAVNWQSEPKIIDEQFQDSFIVTCGNPSTAVYAHLDNVGFMAGYNNQITPMGSPDTQGQHELVGYDSKGKIEAKLSIVDETLFAEFDRIIESGTELSFNPHWRETEFYIQCCYLDNRAGIYAAIQTARKTENIALVFGQWEEHGGGSVSYLSKYLYEKHNIRQALISDITYVSEGVKDGQGVAVSLRDRAIPRKQFVNRIRNILDTNNFSYQIEVEEVGGSDGHEIQKLAYPIDWCFVGAPQQFSHSPNEKINKADLESMIAAYRILLKHL
ncbi:MAG TPA: M20/M25/M40 family metallo-hydrolase [Bacteroidia bacterium]|nr:M20/M25/M40 family metallo-hydrolase [Bacteroidia bacterium]